MKRIGLPLACALLLAGPACFLAVSDTDTGWHVALGRLILQGRFPRTNSLSWAFGDYPWYATSWLYDAIIAASSSALPEALGAQIFTFVLFAAALGALALACDSEGSAWIVPAIAIVLVPRVVPRPHVASWAALAAALALAPRGIRSRWIAIGAIAVAGNFHAGAAFAAAIVGLEALEAFWRTRRRIELAAAAGAGLALAANPGFLFDARYLLEHLFTVNDVVQLQEFEPPFFAAVPSFYLLLPVTLLIAVHRRRERPALLAAAILFAALGLRAQRMVFEAQLVWAPALAWGLSRLRWPAAIGLGLALVACLVVRFDPLRIRPSIAWNEQLLPVRAARFLDRQGLAGPGFNAFRDGGYLEAARPAAPAFIDGRVQAVPPQVLIDLQQAESTPAAFQAWLRRLGCEWAITTRVRERLGGWRRLYDTPEWDLVYWDEVSEIFVRSDVARLARVPRYRHFHPWGHLFEGLPRSDLAAMTAEIERFRETSPDDPFALVARCAALRLAGSPLAPAACNLRVPPALQPLYTKALSYQAAP